jgi:hypothetical protein
MITDNPLPTVQRMFQAFSNRDPDRLLETVSSRLALDICWCDPRPAKRVYVGRDGVKLDVDIAEARFDLRDLREILSHTLVPYTQQTGKVVIKEHDRMRQIELRARISKRLLGQERLPLGPNKLLGQHFPIPVGMKVEVKPEEGE